MHGTREPQYNALLSSIPESLGLMTGHAWQEDPKRLAFTLSRYKFVSKMLEGRNSVLEVGCADAFGSRIVLQSVGKLTAVDFDPIFIADINDRQNAAWPIRGVCRDILTGSPFKGEMDAAYSLDVIEHIAPEHENTFIANIKGCLTEHGILIVGTPSLASQHIASPLSKAGHVNCKNAPELKQLLEGHFHTVLMFGMNDEVLHTGHHMMAHYLFAVCCEPKERR